MSADILNVARKSLNDALGDKSKAYFGHMKTWFKMRITKEEFDQEARVLLSAEQVHLHNEFFLAILNKVEGLAELTVAPGAAPRARHHRHHQHRPHQAPRNSFEPVDVLDYVPPGEAAPATGDALRYAAQELFLPDQALVTGRFMLTAWDQGLEGADDATIDLMVAAVQVFLKNILTVVITQRKGYKVREGKFAYDMGSDVPNMWLRNTTNLNTPSGRGPTELDTTGDALAPSCPLTMDEAEQATAYSMACGIPELKSRRDRVSVSEVYEALKLHKNVISSHSVYTVNMERMATTLCHPSY